MRYFIYGSDCNASYSRVSEILKNKITFNDEVITTYKVGVNEQVIEYCNNHNIKYQVISEEVEYKTLAMLVSMKSAYKSIFIFSQLEPPHLNYAYLLFLQYRFDLSKIIYEFI